MFPAAYRACGRLDPVGVRRRLMRLALLPGLLLLLARIDAAQVAGTPVDPAGFEPVLVEGRLAHPTRILARRLPGAQAAVAASALSSAGFVRVRDYALVPGLTLLDESAPSAAGPQALAAAPSAEQLLDRIAALRQSGLYEYVEPDYLVFADATPTDAAFTDGTLWGLRNTGQNGGVAGMDINAVPAWDITTGSSSVIVAVIDSGVRVTHQDLAAQMWHNPGEIAGNGIDDDGNGYVDDVFGIDATDGVGPPDDVEGHGTFVAGIIGAAANNGKRAVGVAWNVRLMALRFLDSNGSGLSSEAVECMEYAVAHGARIVNCSWGDRQFSRALFDSMDSANAQGVLVVASAGNEGTNADYIPHNPSAFDLPNVISVAAIDRTGQLAEFSNYGFKTVDIAAPGVSIESAALDSDSAYVTQDGTSASAPHVSGVAALLLANQPSISVADLRDRIVFSAAPLAALDDKVASRGRVDAYRALTLAPDGNLELAVYPSSGTFIFQGDPVVMKVRVSDLDGVTGATVTGNVAAGGIVTFVDDGSGVDEVAGDGFYTAVVNPPTTRNSLYIVISVSAPGKAGTFEVYEYWFVQTAADTFAQAKILASTSNGLSTSNEDATTEPGEPLHAGVAGGASLWWTWTAPGDGPVTIDTFGSSIDTLLAVYTGSSVENLTEVASNDDSGEGGTTSKLGFEAVEGVSYHIVVDSADGEMGTILFHMEARPRPANDLFSRSIPLSGSNDSASGSTKFSALEPGEPAHGATPDGGSIWWTWIAPASGTARIHLSNVAFHDPRIAVYSGDAVNALVRHPGRPDDAFATGPQYTFSALAGTTYRIAIGRPETHDGGTFDIAVELESGPVNDRFADRIFITGESVLFSGNNLNGTIEVGEQNHMQQSTLVSRGTSTWWTWTATQSGNAELTASSTGFNPAIAIYTGTSLQDLTFLSGSWDGIGPPDVMVVGFPVVAGVQYHIVVDAYTLSGGPFSFEIVTRQPPGNDMFADRFVLAGENASVGATNVGASRESGEPRHGSQQISDATVWWTWTAPYDGIVDITSENARMLVAVYTGEDFATLTRVPQLMEGRFDASRVLVRVDQGITYQIAVEGQQRYREPFVLTLKSYSIPENDAFADRAVFTGSSVSGATFGATSEPPETSTQATIWWKWTAQSDGTAVFSATGLLFPVILKVQTGTSLGALSPVLDARPFDPDVCVFHAVAGVEYNISAETSVSSPTLVNIDLELVVPPVNDTFAARAVLVGEAAHDTASAAYATLEVGEPEFNNSFFPGSLWWEWTAPADGTVLLSQTGSDQFGTMRVFRGATLGSLQLVAEPNPGGYSLLERLIFDVTAGTRYQIAVMTPLDANGHVELDLRMIARPGNDQFATAAAIAEGSATVAGTLVGSTIESGEPHVGSDGIDSSVWWKWTTPISGRAVVRLQDSLPHRRLNAYSGPAIDGLTHIASNGIANHLERSGAIAFDCTAGSTYFVAVACRTYECSDFELQFLVVDPPGNDAFAAATEIPSDGGDTQSDNLGATMEALETQAAQASVWWSWTAPATGKAAISTEGSDFDTILSVYTGAALGALTYKGESDNGVFGGRTSTLAFDAEAGTTYHIQVGGRSGDMGLIELHLEMGSLPAAPATSTTPGSAVAGRTVTLATDLVHTGPVAYQWFRDGVEMPGGTAATLRLASAQHFDEGSYFLRIQTLYGAVESALFALNVNAPPASTARPMNLSTRGLCLTGDGLLIPGFVIQGSGTKRLLIRGVGPSLFGLGVTDFLADPTMTLHRWNPALNGTGGFEVVVQNDEWGSNGNAAEIAATSAVVGAFALNDESHDAALLLDLPPGQYTVAASGVAGGTGIALVELYDADAGTPTAQLVNISNRGHVGTGGDIMIPGFVVSNEGSRTFLIRAVGPSLNTVFGLNGVLADPQLTIFSGPSVILANDDWDGIAGSANTAAVAQQVGAFALDAGSKDAAFVVTLPPGPYTAQASGVGGAIGVALVEVYLVP